MRRLLSVGLLSAVVAAAIGAALLVQYMPAPAAVAVSRAGTEMMQVLRDEHAAISDYLRNETEAQRLANAAAVREAEGMKLATRMDAQPLPRVAQTEREPKRVVAAIEKKTSPVRLEPVRVAAAAAPSQPLQLLPMTTAGTAPATRPPLVRVAIGAVSGKLRQLAATVEHVPSWLVSAGDWVSDAVPVSRRPDWDTLELRATL
jgi:hypothetical protein